MLILGFASSNLLFAFILLTDNKIRNISKYKEDMFVCRSRKFFCSIKIAIMAALFELFITKQNSQKNLMS
jgi:uncharacterized membrane protein SpoIIM required for sporulation